MSVVSDFLSEMNERTAYDIALETVVGDEGKTWRIVSKYELRDMLEKAMDEVLLPREKIALYYRFGLWNGDEHTFKELGQLLGVSPRRAGQIARSGLIRLRRSRYSSLTPHLEEEFKEANVKDTKIKRVRSESVRLTKTESSVLCLLGEGKTNTEISAELFISINTVRSHLKAVYAKVGISDRVKLALYASEKLKRRSKMTIWERVKNQWNSWGRETKNFVIAGGLFIGSLFFKIIGIVGCGILLFLVFRRWYKMRGRNE